MGNQSVAARQGELNNQDTMDDVIRSIRFTLSESQNKENVMIRHETGYQDLAFNADSDNGSDTDSENGDLE